jgi:CDP-paratose 2-epimerase
LHSCKQLVLKTKTNPVFNMKILITGGAGFIGSSLCIQLKEKYPAYSIIAFDNLKRRGSELNLADFQKKGIEFIHGDIRNNEDLSSIKEFDVFCIVRFG